MEQRGVDQERSTTAARAKAAQAACPHAEWEEVGFSRDMDVTGLGDLLRILVQCPACGLMRWADEEVPRGG
jgi:hypothetical protein